jgi:sensor histidine kinase YesM
MQDCKPYLISKKMHWKKHLVKEIKNSMIASAILMVFVLILCWISEGLRNELQNGLLVLFVCSEIVFFNAFFTSALLGKKRIIIGAIGATALSFGLIHLSEILFLDFLFFGDQEQKYTVDYLALIGIFMSILAYLFHSYRATKVEVKRVNVKYPIKNSLLFSGLVVFSYIVVSAINLDANFFDGLYFLFEVLFTNWIVNFSLSIFLFHYIYRDYQRRKNLAYLYYVIIFVFILVACLMKYNRLSAINFPNVLSYMIIRVPFSFMIVLSVQISYMLEFSKQEKKLLQQESLAAKLNLQQLKNQLSPHFLFNNINVLTSLIEESPKRAVRFSENLSRIYRYFLEQEKEDLVLLKEEMEFAKTYLSLFKDRFEEAIEFEVEQMNDQELYVISTGLQQVLENVIKHNRIEKENPIKIAVKREGNYLVIRNNCRAKNHQEDSLGNGLSNMKARYSYFTDQEMLIEHSDQVFVVKLPLLEVSK